MFKLGFLFRLTVAAALIGVVFSGVYLQEIRLAGDTFATACTEAGVNLPLKDPRIEIDCSNRTLTVFEGDLVVRRYDVGLGKNSRLGVLKRGANSTPLGEYKIIRKAVREDMFSRGARFLEIDFPSGADLDMAWQAGQIEHGDYTRALAAVEKGERVPLEVPVGGVLGIQGNNFMFQGGRFTDGSIAMRNGELIDMFEHIAVGTPVIITE